MRTLPSGLAVLAALAALAGDAEAFPQFQLSSGAARCSECHFGPAGGGLINGYGRYFAGDELSAGAWDSAPLHGAWTPPAWLAIGGDLRHAALVNDRGGSEGPELAAFPMQADLHLRLQAGAFSLNATGGVRGAARPRDTSLARRLVSREHYLMWQPEPQGVYLRAGRFFAPFGLRNVEHTAFVRRHLGSDLLEEPYGASAGLLEHAWELHATAFVPSPVEPVGHRGRGAAIYYERRFLDDAATWGAQARVAAGPADDRYVVGMIGKSYREGPRLLFMAEVDLGVQAIGATATGFDGARRGQLTSFVSGTWFPTQGWMFDLSYERRDDDLRARGTGRNAISVQAHWFVRAHVELLLHGRVLVPEGGRPEALAMSQVHYYL